MQYNTGYGGDSGSSLKKMLTTAAIDVCFAALYVLIFLGSQLFFGTVIGVIYSIAPVLSYTTVVSLSSVLSAIATLCAIWLIIKLRKRKVDEVLNVRKIGAPSYPLLALLGVSSSCVLSLIMALIPFPEKWMESYAEKSDAIMQNSFLMFLATVIFAPVTEEIIFRGLAYKQLKHGMPRWAAIIVISAVFGVMHGTVIWAFYTTLFGALLAWVYDRYDSILACITMHMAFNLFGVLAMYINRLPEVALGALSMLLIVLFLPCVVGVYFLTGLNKQN